jgi:prepilin-type N-terminal cleavage/methylation domain-containing protein
MAAGAAGRARSARRAFTLIELLAVLLIMGLIAGLAFPNLSLRSERAVLDAAREVAATFAYARQRAVATGAPHRVVLDLDVGAWWIEAQPEPPSLFAPPEALPAQDAAHTIALAPPARAAEEFAPLPGPSGRPRELPDELRFDSIETQTAGALLSGQVGLVFESDGTADPALLVLANEAGDLATLRLARLADEVRIARE